MTLLEACTDRPVRILEIMDPQARAQCIRFGIGEGSVVAAERLNLGPVLVRYANCEVALGRELARKILVEEAPEAAMGERPGGSPSARTGHDRRPGMGLLRRGARGGGR